MNSNKFILAAALTLGVVSIASAQSTNFVYMSGSTAARSQVYATMINPGAVFTAAPSTTLYLGSATPAGNGATYMAFSGQLVGGTAGDTTVIECNWSGSEAGFADVALNQSENFLTPATLDGTDHGTNVPTAGQLSLQTVTLAMGDNAQIFSAVYGNNPGTPPAVLTKSTEVGVITFKWLRNPGQWTGANVTDSQIRQALTGGIKLAVFSGVSTDTNNYVYVSGRDSSSGTRVNAYGDTGFGIFTTPSQIELSGGAMQPLSFSTNTHTHVVTTNYIGNFGFSSGGSLAKSVGGASTTSSTDLVQTSKPTGFSVIAYLGFSDATTAEGLTPPGVELNYDGVPFSVAAVENGQYTFWGNEYCSEANAAIGVGDTDQVYANLISLTSGITHNANGTSLIDLNQMQSTRSGPTSDPVHN